ncbi:AAA family ATPase [Actinokineospora bangkokensis]|uniref:Nuclease SbcCD subunit C n=1 Tax=Actinokineospora bangkokensis TaxID=1193682 RepID=A0A1Q9LS03_9PSEU|nr:AAA family ATPase [Actinokineospora bangkokensis]OLR94798.1 hypothetical protein BJP25_09185 [Actinokineospora bangkokensis]
MEKVLVDLVFERAEKDERLDDRAKGHILSALLGQDPRTGAERRESDPPAEEAAAPASVFLCGVTVEGFRGIGPKATLDLHPGPGLTIVTGSNGTGKSSFAEAVEFALTEDSYRWRQRPKQWAEIWRNLHHDHPCGIRVALAIDGAGKTVVGAEWERDTGLPDAKLWVQVEGDKQVKGLDGLGWATPLENYRPILTYEELGGLLRAGPAKLYDALEKVLGLGLLKEAAASLHEAVKAAEEPVLRVRERTNALQATLPGLDDARAGKALSEVTKRKPDVDVVAALATGTGEVNRAMDGLRNLAEVVVPDAGAVHALAAEHEAAEKGVLGLGAASELAERRLDLLEQALGLHDAEGDQLCPVCRTGQLDQVWREQAFAESEGASAALREDKQVRQRLREAQRRVGDLLSAAPVLPEADLPSMPAARAAVEAWRAIPRDQGAGERLRARHTALVAAVAAVRDEARAELARLDDAWNPVARELAVWVEARRAADAVLEEVKSLKAAKKWLVENAAEVRNARLLPFADQARDIWRELREESTVELGAVTLEGSNNSRRVRLAARTDGAGAEALGVMSQGEMHALVLALFLPRAVAEQSPFRFVLLDDPVQAMDPSRVAAFARLLAGIAATRQVVVFSHDDRLPAAVRRLVGVNARIVEITRSPGSVVSTQDSSDPAERYVSDLRAVVKDPRVPEEIQREVLPSLCRAAVEAASREVHYARVAGSGASHGAAEAEWTAKQRTRERVTLAVGTEKMTRWVKEKPWRDATLKVCTSGVHKGAGGHPQSILEDLEKTVDDLRALA